MAYVVASSALLIALATFVHYEVLGTLSLRLPALPVPRRAKVLVVVFGAVVAHGVEIGLYGFGLFLLASHAGVGGFMRPAETTLMTCLYFSAETYSSLGFGDLAPVGPIRLLAGVEALNGLLLIGWSASFLYIAMEQFWRSGSGDAGVAKASEPK